MRKKVKKKNPAKPVIMAILIIIIISGIFFIISNKVKPSLTAEGFKQTMQEKGFSIIDLTSQYTDNDDVAEAYAAVNENYKIDFYLLSGSSSAKQFAKKARDDFKSSAEDSPELKSKNSRNYGTFTLTSSVKYREISRVNDSVIVVNVLSKYQDEVANLLDELGY